MRAFVRYDKKGIIVPSSFVMKRNKPKVGRWLEISTTKSVSGAPTQSSQGNLRAFVRYNGQNKIVSGSIVVRGQVPENGNWAEITYDVRRPIGNERPFILEYTITSPNTTISIPLGGPNFSGYDFTADWGDGTSTDRLANADGNQLEAQMVHTYAEPGVYNIEILGKFPYLYLYGGTNKNLLTDIKQWGTTKWESFGESFRECAGLTNITATDTPNFSRIRLSLGLTDSQFNNTFRGCSNLTNLEFTRNWNFKGVEKLDLMFALCSSLTEFSALETWNTSTIVNMLALFGITNITSNDLLYMSDWDVSKVQIFQQIFTVCDSLTNLNGLANWNVSSATNISSMFERNTNLSDISALVSWNVSSVTTMGYMFFECKSLNNIEALSNWNTSNVTNMYAMFNQNPLDSSINVLNNWNVSSVTTMEYMFDGGGNNSSNNITSPSVDLNNWNVSSVTKMQSIFDDQFFITNLGIDQWNIKNVSDLFNFPCQNSTLTTENYDAILIGWASQIPLAYNGTLVFGNSKYTLYGAAEAARNALIADVGAIVDGGGIDNSFTFTVKTDNTGTSTPDQFTIPTLTTGITQPFNYEIQTSDGQSILGVTGNHTITFPTPGEYEIKIIGSFPYMYFDNGGDRLKMLDIKQFGNYALGSTSQDSAFYGCSNMVISATDIGHFDSVTNFYYAWFNCSSLTSFPLIDTSSGISFGSTWYGCSSLTSFPLLDTSNGTSFFRTWQSCINLTSFPLLDTSSGTDFQNAWTTCSSLTSFPLLDTSSGTSFLQAWTGCTSLTTFPANAFDTNIATYYASAFQSTNLTTQSIDDILVSLDTCGVSNGIFRQTGGQAPSATGLAARDNLVAKGWSIVLTT